MEQLSKEAAIEFAQSGKWKNWPDRVLVGFQLFQDKLCIPFDVYHAAIERVLGRPVWTHEFGLNHDGLIAEYLGQRNAPTFQEIMDLVPEEKRIVLFTDETAKEGDDADPRNTASSSI